MNAISTSMTREEARDIVTWHQARLKEQLSKANRRRHESIIERIKQMQSANVFH